jgi:hypothetical protein
LRYDLPSKKISLQKSSALEFLNLTLKTSEASGIGLGQWAKLRFARKNLGKTDSVLLLESLMKSARIYFSKNITTLPSHAGSHSLIARMTRENC